MPTLLTLPPNMRGRDFIVADIHGHFDVLREKLASVAFDVQKDRLLSVGDLIDRHEASLGAREWLAQPWFFAVRGNHEQAMFDWLDALCSGATAERVRELAARHLGIGGEWATGLLADALDGNLSGIRMWRDQLAALPVAIETTVRGTRVGVVHAGAPGHDWRRLQIDPMSPHDLHAALWQRPTPLDQDAFIRGIDIVFTGHTRVKRPVAQGNTIRLETGVWSGGDLTLVNATDWLDFRPPPP